MAEEKEMICASPTVSGESPGANADDRRGRPRVLIVDDEELVLASLQNLFRFETDFELCVETSPSRAFTSSRPSASMS
jgi:hypothetical protein